LSHNASVRIHPTAEVSPDAHIGDGTVIWNNAQVRENAVIGRNCSLGKDVYVDNGAILGSGIKIQNCVNVCVGVTIEDDVLIGPHVSFTNDLFPRAFKSDWRLVPTLVKRGASIGGGVTVVCGNVIGEYAMVAAGCVVSRDVPPHALVVGNPMRIAGYVCRCGHKVRSTTGAESVAGPLGRLSCDACGDSFTVQ
jgi:acetyltransferase-like isoleucine patch superfamily enzyme